MDIIPLRGNLTKDPKFINKKNQAPRAIFTIAINERYGKDGENEVTHFAQCTAFWGLAENIANSLSKGDPVLAFATLNTYPKEVEIDGEDVNLTMTAFTVVEMGPGLRYAEAEVTRIRKDEEDEAPKKSTSKKSRKTSEPDDDEDDEEEEAPKKSRVKSKAKKKAKDDDEEEEEEEDDEF